MNLDDLARQISEKVIADTQYVSALIGLFGVFCGSAISIIGNLLMHRLSANKERQQQILKIELERLFQLEEMAGEITEWAGSWQLDHNSNELNDKFHSFKVAAGKFRKFPKLKQAIRDLNQHAMILVDDKRKNNDQRESRQELEVMYEKFLTEYNEVLNSIKT